MWTSDSIERIEPRWSVRRSEIQSNRTGCRRRWSKSVFRCGNRSTDRRTVSRPCKKMSTRKIRATRTPRIRRETWGAPPRWETWSFDRPTPIRWESTEIVFVGCSASLGMWFEVMRKVHFGWLVRLALPNHFEIHLNKLMINVTANTFFGGGMKKNVSIAHLSDYQSLKCRRKYKWTQKNRKQKRTDYTLRVRTAVHPTPVQDTILTDEKWIETSRIWMKKVKILWSNKVTHSDRRFGQPKHIADTIGKHLNHIRVARCHHRNCSERFQTTKHKRTIEERVHIGYLIEKAESNVGQPIDGQTHQEHGLAARVRHQTTPDRRDQDGSQSVTGKDHVNVKLIHSFVVRNQRVEGSDHSVRDVTCKVYQKNAK